MKPRKAAVIFIFITVTLEHARARIDRAGVAESWCSIFSAANARSAAKMFGIFGTVFALMPVDLFRRCWVCYRIDSAGDR